MERFKIGHNGLASASMFSEKEATNLICHVQPHFSKPLELISVEVEDEPPQLQVIEGGRK